MNIREQVKTILETRITVSIGVDGGEGHVYRNTPLKVFQKDRKSGKIFVTRSCNGLTWSNEVRPSIDSDFDLPTYGNEWVK